jgi:hypothetical protein
MEFFSLLHGINMALGVVLVVLTFGFLLFSNNEE